MIATKVGAGIPRRYRDVKPCPRCGIERRSHPSRSGLCRDCASIANPNKETQ